MWLLLSLAVVALAAYWYFWSSSKKEEDFWGRLGFPVLPSEITLWQMLMGEKTTLETDMIYYGKLQSGKVGFGGVVEFGTPTLFIRDLDLARAIFIKDFSHFCDRRDFSKADKVFSEAMLFMKGKQWRETRRYLTPALTSNKIRRMFPYFERSSIDLSKYIESLSALDDCKEVGEREGVDVSDIIRRFAISVIGLAAFGLDIDVFRDSTFYEMAERMSKMNVLGQISFMISQNFPKFADFLGDYLYLPPSCDKGATEYFITLLNGVLKSRKEGKDVHQDVLQLLVDAQRGTLEEDEGEVAAQEEQTTKQFRLSDASTIKQAFLFLIAGFDSVANNLMIAVYLLAVYPEIQQRIYEELVSLKGEFEGKVEYETINRMEYLNMYISEVMRLYPAAGRLERECNADYKIEGSHLTIPKGTTCAFVVEAFHRDPEYFPDPMRFDPERFSAENKAKRNPYCYMPFGIGPRNCIGIIINDRTHDVFESIGQAFALQETKAALAILINKFKIEPAKSTQVPEKMFKDFFGYRTYPGLKLCFIPRE